MKRTVGVAGAVVALVVLAGLAKRIGSKMQNVDWEKRFESMPDNAPPKWMFRNISEIRENTDRILELLEHRQSFEPRSTTDAGAPKRVP